MSDRFSQRVKIFKALGHPIRLRIVERLGDGEECVCKLLEMFDVDMSTLSRHLAVLKNADILEDCKRGKNVFYRLKRPCLIWLFQCLDGDCGSSSKKRSLYTTDR